MRAYLERVLRTAVAAAAAVLCSVSPAQAAFYSGAWDPLYGEPFVGTTVDSGNYFGSDVGWRGTVDVFVPNSCALATTPTNRTYGPSSPCVGDGSDGETFPYVQSAEVKLFRWDGDTNNDNDVIIGTLVFSASSMTIRELNFEGSDLISLFTRPSNWVQPLGAPSTSPYFSLLFVDKDVSNFLRAPFGSGFLGQLLGLRDEIPPDYFGPLLLSHPTRGFGEPIDSIEGLFTTLWDARSIAVSDVEGEDGLPRYLNGGALFSLAAPATDIPEPGSLALVALALFATAWVARTRRRV